MVLMPACVSVGVQNENAYTYILTLNFGHSSFDIIIPTNVGAFYGHLRVAETQGRSSSF